MSKEFLPYWCYHFVGLNLCMSCAGNYGCCEFMISIAMLCPEESGTQQSFPSSASYILSTPFSLMFLETWMGMVVIKISHLGKNSQSLILSILIHLSTELQCQAWNLLLCNRPQIQSKAFSYYHISVHNLPGKSVLQCSVLGWRRPLILFSPNNLHS